MKRLFRHLKSQQKAATVWQMRSQSSGVPKIQNQDVERRHTNLEAKNLPEKQCFFLQVFPEKSLQKNIPTTRKSQEH